MVLDSVVAYCTNVIPLRRGTPRVLLRVVCQSYIMHSTTYVIDNINVIAAMSSPVSSREFIVFELSIAVYVETNIGCIALDFVSE